MALTITDDNFQELVNSGLPMVIDFWAEWCGPCRTLAPVIEELATEYEGKVNIGKCDVSDNDNLAAKFKITSLPTILILKDGEVVDKQVGGGIGKATLSEKISSLLRE